MENSSYSSTFLIPNLSEALNTAIRILWRAYELAKDLRCNAWQFAVEMEELRRLGVGNSELRWLIAKGFVEHACEVSIDLNGRRRFSRIVGLSLPPGACFVLSNKVASFGVIPQVKVGGTLLVINRLTVKQSPTTAKLAAPSSSIEDQLPFWDKSLRQLRLGALIVKEFRTPARNQELVIGAFQEEHWPKRIDDPLPPVAGQDCRRRLTDTIKHLNRSQANPVLRFHGDGRGSGIIWELLL